LESPLCSRARYRQSGETTREVGMSTMDTQNTEHAVRFITYFLDNEPQKTTEATLTVGQILKNGGLDPNTHYLIELRGHQQIEYRNIDQSIEVHEKEKFISVFHGPTPLS
jgi:hypothetical protein